MYKTRARTRGCSVRTKKTSLISSNQVKFCLFGDFCKLRKFLLDFHLKFAYQSLC